MTNKFGTFLRCTFRSLRAQYFYTAWSRYSSAPRTVSKFKSHVNRGFTLMEMLMTIGLIALIGSMTLFVDINSYRGGAFRSEIDAVGTALQTARADSFNNIDQAKHGVAFKPGGFDGYVIFEGNTYATRDNTKDVLLKASYEVSFSGASPTEIVFDQLSGNANYDGDVTMIDNERGMTGAISINHEGKIAW